MSKPITSEEALRTVRNSVAGVHYKDLPPKTREEVIKVSAIVSGPSSYALPKDELSKLVQGAFAQVGMDVQCYEVQNSGSQSLVVRNKEDGEITGLDPNKDVAYVPDNSRGFRDNERLYERGIDLNHSLIVAHEKLVGILEQNDFYVRRVNEDTISDTAYGVEFTGSVIMPSKK